MVLNFRKYIIYKFVNSLFTGAVAGSVFTIYSSLTPATFSLGGILLALGLMLMAYLYHRLMTLKYFRLFSLSAEWIMLSMIIYFLTFSHYLFTAILVYSAYQLSFILGGYLVRAETFFSKKARIMGWIDIAKQKGYIAGLALSYLFYKLLEVLNITLAYKQVYALHIILLPLEIIIIILLFQSFKSTTSTN